MSALGGLVWSWPMLGSVGAGLVLTALAAGAEIVAGAVLAGCGIAALGWGVFALRAGHPVAPRATIGISVALLVASAALAATGTSFDQGIPALPLLAADLLVAVVALGAAGEMRSRRRRRASGRAGDRVPDSLRGVHAIGLIVGATLVAALATPALAATGAGDLAVPHGELHAPAHEHR